MKIEDNRLVKDAVHFCDINMGDAFVYNREVYIKTECSGIRRNAFNLVADYPTSFDADQKVVPVNAKVVIE